MPVSQSASQSVSWTDGSSILSNLQILIVVALSLVQTLSHYVVNIYCLTYYRLVYNQFNSSFFILILEKPNLLWNHRKNLEFITIKIVITISILKVLKF